MSPTPRPNLWDHARVLGLFLILPLSLLWIGLWLILSPVLKPMVRRRLRRRIQEHAPPIPAEPAAPDPEAWAGRTIFVSAGEASGDRVLAKVVAAIRTRCPEVTIRGYAGPETAAAGAALDRELTPHAVMGVVAVLRTTKFWWTVCVETLAIFREEKPDVFLSVDFPGLNGTLAPWARRQGIHTVHLVPPSVWAYAPWRIRRWRKAVTRMLTVFPFEPALFEGRGQECLHVGHPSFEAPLPPPRTPETWPGDGPCVVEILPGSRREEILRHIPVLLDAAKRVRDRMPEVSFVVRLAHERNREAIDVPDLRVVVGEAPLGAPLLGALATSGTVTAELGAALVPHGLFYRVTVPLWLLAQGGITAPWIGLVNLIAGREVAPERLVVGSDGERVAEDFLRVAGSAEVWESTRAVLSERVRSALVSEGVADRAARAVLSVAEFHR